MKVPMPKGFRRRENSPPKVSVVFPEDLFTKIKKFARAEGKPFSAAVCELCSLGLFDLEESDALEATSLSTGRSLRPEDFLEDREEQDV